MKPGTDRHNREVERLRKKVNDLEATVMLLGSDLESVTLAMHEQQKLFEKVRSEVERLRKGQREETLDPLPKPEEDRPPHY